jgi:putative MATE family efflux protein
MTKGAEATMQADRNGVMRFVVPVTVENMVTVVVGIAFSTLMGRISESALAATNTANLIINLYVSAFSLLSVGSAVLTARLTGARETGDASRTVEQSILMTGALSLLLTLLSMLGAYPIMRLSMPKSDAQLFSEAVRYFRVLSLSIPGLMLWNVLMSVLRASGNSRAPLATAVVVNLSQIIFAYLFIVVIPMNVLGAALSFVFCRIIGGTMALVITMRSRQNFYVRARNILRPHAETIRRIVRIGLPTTFEQAFVQIGYIIANALVVGLGTVQATIYNVANSLNSFANIPLSVAAAISTTFVGQLIGAKRQREAKRFGLRLLFSFIPIVLAFYGAVALFSPRLATFYTGDSAVVSGAVGASWFLMWYALPVMSVNVVDPSLRGGGDGKFVMFQTFIGVWVVRLPLTWLFGYALGMGITGVYLANILGLTSRALIGLIRYWHEKWLYRKV